MRKVVVSVPHSGTRSLVEHLGIDMAGLPGGRWWHFGGHDDLLRRFDGQFQAQIPIRHPMEVARSWAQRRADRRKTGDSLANLLNRYDLMFSYIEGRDVVFHRMEDLPVLKGQAEHGYGDHSLVRRYQDAVLERVIRPNQAFFGQFYDLEAA